MTNLLIVDDHAMTRMGIRQILQAEKTFRILGEADSGEASVELAKKLEPDVVLMDLKMPGMGGLDAMLRILRHSPAMAILILTSVTSPQYPSKLLRLGARGYITKDAAPESLVLAVKKVARGQRYLPQELASQMVTNNLDGKGECPFDRLSNRELQTVLKIVRGNKARDVANEHHIASKTVNTYRYRSFEKLGVKNDVQLALLAAHCGLIDIDEELELDDTA